MLRRVLLGLALCLGLFMRAPAPAEAANLGTASGLTGAVDTGIVEVRYHRRYRYHRRHWHHRHHRHRHHHWRRHHHHGITGITAVIIITSVCTSRVGRICTEPLVQLGLARAEE